MGVRITSLVSTLAVLISITTLTSAVSLPKTLHLRDRLECVPAGAIDVFTFLLLNFGAHVGSVKSYPGVNLPTTVKWVVAAFLLPYSGIIRGCVAIARGRNLFGRQTELQKAARAGALAYVTRGRGWRPSAGQKIKNVGFLTGEQDTVSQGVFYLWHHDDLGLDRLSLSEHTFHGQVDPRLDNLGYELRRVRDWHAVEPFDKQVELNLGNDPSWPKAIAAIVQLGSACYTLYQSRGAQLDRYGYAAYGLCVIPYAVMSLINLIAALVNADYPAIYLVHTEVMEEAIQRGACFSAMVGRIPTADLPDMYTVEVEGGVGPSNDSPDGDLRDHGLVHFTPINISATDARHGTWDDKDRTHDSTFSRLYPAHGDVSRDTEEPVELEIVADGLLARRREPSRHAQPVFRLLRNSGMRHWIAAAIGLAGMVLPYVLVGWLTGGFQPGSQSTVAQRAWTMSWLVCGTVLGLVVGVCLHLTPDSRWALLRRALPIFVVCCAPAIGGCVIVVQEMLQFGSCTVVG